ncbi:hypothetical protein ACOME3_001911 [Neoechinorhynchus agilis]
MIPGDISAFSGLAKNPIIVDIGTSWTKIGIAGEFAPRAIIRTNVIDEEPTSIPIFHISEDFKLRWKDSDLYKLLAYVYYKVLCLNFKDAGCVLIDSDSWSIDLKDSVKRHLIMDADVPFVAFLPSHLCSAYALNLDTALIVDIGHFECKSSVHSLVRPYLVENKRLFWTDISKFFGRIKLLNNSLTIRLSAVGVDDRD